MIKKLLVVDDEKNLCSSLVQFFTLEGMEVKEAGNGISAKRLLEEEAFDAVVSDLKMPGMDGLALLEWMQEAGPELPLIMISAFGDVEDAVEAMKRGAADYVVKPFDPEELLIRLQRVSTYRNLEASPQTAGAEKKPLSPAMAPLYKTADKAAPTLATVLITGESGTGKEVMARYIHNHSPRSREAFLPVNLGGIPETLMESELFGYEKGAFTGAERRKIGYFEAAGGGTIFLDEIGEAPLQLQVKLLRVLQERSISRVSGIGTIPVDIRIIAATNRNLEEMVARGEFREDLYYRLNVIHLKLPPLRERQEDIAELALLFLDRFSTGLGKKIDRVDQKLMEALHCYCFPGNIRELENMMERAVILAEGTTLSLEDLPLQVQEGLNKVSPENGGEVGIPEGGNRTSTLITDAPLTLEELEREAIKLALLRNDGHREKSAGELGITRRTLLNKIKEYGF